MNGSEQSDEEDYLQAFKCIEEGCNVKCINFNITPFRIILIAIKMYSINIKYFVGTSKFMFK